jgi:hypothetical protein
VGRPSGGRDVRDSPHERRGAVPFINKATQPRVFGTRLAAEPAR